MSTVAVLPVASVLAANAALESQGFGPDNFSVPAYAGPGATHAALHCWTDAAFEAAVQAIAGVAVDIADGDPVARTAALIEAQGARWGAQAPALQGSVTPGLYQYDEALWWVIQPHNRSVYGGDPGQYPALIRRVRIPGQLAAWTQPIDQYDSYTLQNPFTGQPDECEHAGKRWRTTRNTNVWEPGTPDSGWVELDDAGEPIEPPAPQPDEWPQWVQPTGGHDAYPIGAKVTFNGQHYISAINANVWSPATYPAGWVLQP